ncbi:reverse transcriptase domain-containing protein [Nephila pilipes]|uniref:Reverse transcriptase domain-containing protein n=1 Tax=Nephila pilipes TaxID=299642 RepID=A0A8X6QZJ5_NEPPI|nr:reverse transcriptase domain-containing protein [Nephila pilipes]
MTRVPLGVTLSPFILATTIEYHIRKFSHERHETVQMLNTALHMDDLFYRADTVEKALQFFQIAAEILKEASMNLRKFKMISKELRKLWFERDTDEQKVTKECHLKVLGIIWNTEDDAFKLDVHPILNMIYDLKNSKCSVLETVSENI